MKQLIACCGLDCESCDARIATVKNDNELFTLEELYHLRMIMS